MTPRDLVEEAGFESFPASDPPAFGCASEREAEKAIRVGPAASVSAARPPEVEPGSPKIPAKTGRRLVKAPAGRA